MPFPWLCCCCWLLCSVCTLVPCLWMFVCGRQRLYQVPRFTMGEADGPTLILWASLAYIWRHWLGEGQTGVPLWASSKTVFTLKGHHKERDSSSSHSLLIPRSGQNGEIDVSLFEIAEQPCWLHWVWLSCINKHKQWWHQTLHHLWAHERYCSSLLSMAIIRHRRGEIWGRRFSSVAGRCLWGRPS